MLTIFFTETKNVEGKFYRD